MKKVFIVDAKRTAIGSMLGTLKDKTPGEIGSVVVKNILETTKNDEELRKAIEERIDELIPKHVVFVKYSDLTYPSKTPGLCLKIYPELITNSLPLHH